MDRQDQGSPSKLPGDLEESVLQLKPFYHTDLRNNLENIAFETNTGRKQSALERIFLSKTKILKASVKALLQEIELRENLDLHLLAKIDDELCRQHSLQMQLKNFNTNYSFDLFMEIKKSMLQVEDNVLELEKEKRKEYLECWRDLMFLKKYLLSALKDYWEITRKREILTGDLNQAREDEPRA